MVTLIRRGSGLVALPLLLLFALSAACASPEPGAGRRSSTAGSPARAVPPEVPGRSWRIAEDPDDLGWEAGRLRRVLRGLDSMDTAAFMLITGGLAVAREGTVRNRYRMHSIRKSLLSALFGVYTTEGLIGTEATVSIPRQSRGL